MVAFVKQAIAEHDLEAIASIDEQAPFRMSNEELLDMHHKAAQLSPPKTVSVGKYLLYDVLNDCWEGTADLNNPDDCARMNANLSPWKNPELIARSTNAPKSPDDSLRYAAE